MTAVISELGTSNSSGFVTQGIQPLEINNSGQIVGYFGATNTEIDGTFLSQNGIIAQIGPANFLGSAINNSGMVAGSYSYFDPNNVLGPTYRVLAIYQNGTFTQLGSLGASDANQITATAINSSGEIVGSSGDNGDPTVSAFLYQNGKFLNLGGLPGTIETFANGINDNGEIVGASYSSITSNSLGGPAVVWHNGTITALASLPGATAGYGVAKAINNSGLIVGQSSNVAAMWQNGVVSSLGMQAGYASSIANSVNNSGLIVGDETSPAQYAKLPISFDNAVIWENGAIIDLNTLLPAYSGWVLADATGINDQDQIIGTGTYIGSPASFVLTLSSQDLAASFSAATALQYFSSGTLVAPTLIRDNASNIDLDLDQLQALTAAGKISSITVTDSGIPNLAISASQLANDAGTLKLIAGSFTLSESATIANSTINGIAGVGDTVSFSGTASAYNIAVSNDGKSVVVTDTATGRTSVDILTNVTAVKFSDLTDIVAQMPGTTTVTTGNITELYGAVFGRLPDVAGLAFYEQELLANPALTLTTFAQWFLASPEYVSNPAHNYMQTSAGETQFITDSYKNLLSRTPESGAVPYYLNLISQFTKGLAPGTSAYSSADALAHATVISDFSASPEFLSDVQVTAQTPSSAQHWLVLI